ncbi:MAG: hypothetical protein ACRDI2_12715, partial [Chloroflexota bacterium]
MVAIREARDDERRELARYRADYVAARAPLGPSLAAGALAGFGVYLVPIGVVLGSFVLLRLASLVVAAPARLVMRAFGWGIYRAGRVPATPAASPTPPPVA